MNVLKRQRITYYTVLVAARDTCATPIMNSRGRSVRRCYTISGCSVWTRLLNYLRQLIITPFFFFQPPGNDLNQELLRREVLVT